MKYQIILVLILLSLALAQDCNPLNISQCLANNGKCSWQATCKQQIDCGLKTKLACNLLSPICNWQDQGECGAISDDFCVGFENKNECETKNCVFEKSEKCSLKMDENLSLVCSAISDENLCGSQKNNIGCKKQNKCIFDDNFDCKKQVSNKDTCEGKDLETTICKFTEGKEKQENKCELDITKKINCSINNQDKDTCELKDLKPTICKFTEGKEKQDNKCKLDITKKIDCKKQDSNKDTCEGKDLETTICKFTEGKEKQENKCELDITKKINCSINNQDKDTCEGKDLKPTICKFTEGKEKQDNKCEEDKTKIPDCKKNFSDKDTCEGKDDDKTICTFTMGAPAIKNKCEEDDAKIPDCEAKFSDKDTCEGKDDDKTICTFTMGAPAIKNKCEEDDAKIPDCKKNFRNKDTCEGKDDDKTICTFTKGAPAIKNKCEVDDAKKLQKVDVCNNIVDDEQCQIKVACKTSFDKCIPKIDIKCPNFKNKDECEQQGVCIYNPEAKDLCKGKPLALLEIESCKNITKKDQCIENTCTWNSGGKCKANQLCSSFTLDTCPVLCLSGSCLEIPAIIAKREASGYILEQMGAFIALVYVLTN